jgi:WD40 repeat protein
MRVAMSAASIALVSLTIAFLPAAAVAQRNQPVSIVPNIGDLSTFEDSVLFSPNGQVLAIPEGGWRTDALTLWDLATGRPLRELHYFAFFQAASFTPDGKLIATGHKDGKVNFWDIATGNIVGAVQVGRAATPRDDPIAIQTLWIDEKGQLMVVGDDEGFITVWTIADRKQVNRFKLAPEDKNGNYSEIITARLSVDGSNLIAAINGRTTDASFVRVFDTRTKKEVTSFKLPKQHSFTSSGVIGDDEFVLRFSGSHCKIDELFYFTMKDRKNFTRIYKPTKCDKRANDDESNAPRIFSNPGQSRIIVAQSGDPEIKIWDRSTRRVERTVRWPADASANVIAFSRDLKSGISRAGDELRLYQFETGELLKELASYGYPAENAIASKDGRGILISHEQSLQATEKELDSWRVDELNVRRLKLPASSDITIYDYASDEMIAVGANKKNQIFIFDRNRKGGAQVCCSEFKDGR